MNSLIPALFQSRQSKVPQTIWRLALPMILANISVPLLGFVDTAVIGHLPKATFLAGTALGSLLITVLFWLCGFLRMSTTGLVAQASGRDDGVGITRVLGQGMVFAWALGVVIILCQSFIFSTLPILTGASSELDEALEFARQYFDIRIWIAPVTLSSMVLTGLLIGLGQTKRVLFAIIVCNLINLVADLLFVPVMGLNVRGLAFASVLAELIQIVILLRFVVQLVNIKTLRHLPMTTGLGQLFRLNGTLFLRSALLQLCLSFMTIYASHYGEQAVAINAILMQFFLFISFSMDGIAYALESQVGKSFGANQLWKARLFIHYGLVMALKLSLAYSLIYGLLYQPIVSALTSIPTLRSELASYWWCVLLMPLISFTSFIYDGIFIGLSWVKAMRNSMAIASLGFFILVYSSLAWGNQGLWVAFLGFLLLRGGSQHWMLRRL